MTGQGGSRDAAQLTVFARSLAAAEDKRGRMGGSGGGGSMGMVNLFPLLVIPVFIYNLMALVNGSAEKAVAFATKLNTDALMGVKMASGATWSVTSADILIMVSLVLLFIELIKSTSSASSAIINHGLSLILFIICLVEFLLMPAFATSVFFMIMMMCLLDTLAGVIVTIVAARRDLALGDGGGH